MQVVERGLLEEIAAMRPVSSHRSTEAKKDSWEGFDVGRWIEEYGLRVRRAGIWGPGGYRWILEECPWSGHTDNSAYIVRGSGGWIAAGCRHNSCRGFGWRELREHFEPDAYAHDSARDGGAGMVGDWEASPAPLPSGLPPVATFDSGMLPGPLRAWVLDIAERMQVPLDYVAAGGW